ncbi:MAG: cation:proton antiporter [Candidatus Marinimicrobia bacterium]|nr:cation:proton antiporter [Candidatus Neomarinimicrobiota bacterium]
MTTAEIPILLLIGATIIFGFYFGRNMKYLKLPSIIGYMLLGVLLGPSLLNIFNDQIQQDLSFITEIALGFVALSIGLELKISTLRRLGKGIVYIILMESFMAFLLVFIFVLLFTKNLPTALIFASVAPASAPAGTVAVIQEYRAKGNLTKALYAVVGFDDGVGIVIFGFGAAIARFLLMQQTSAADTSIALAMLTPFKEVIFSLLIGSVIAIAFSLMARRIKNPNDVIGLIFGFVLASIGICSLLHLSLILTNMVIGMIIVNTQTHGFVQKIDTRLPTFMPILFILFFTLAGTNLHINELPSLGLLGIIYVIARTAGLIWGSKIGARIGKSEEKIRKYLGLGILSQAGVAIGLSLIVKHEFQGLGKIVEIVNGAAITMGDRIGMTVITTITVTCIFFEIIGPILTKYALEKAGEIDTGQH